MDITVDYDGPSLSDTSSLISLEEYKNRNGSQQSFSFGTPSVDLDDDSITVSSRDTGGAESRVSSGLGRSRPQPNGSLGSSSNSLQTSSWLSVSHPTTTTPSSPLSRGGPPPSSDQKSTTLNPFSDENELAAADRYPEDPSAVFERLKFQEELGDDRSSVDVESLARNSRGAAWLKDQNERTIRSMLGALPEPSVSDRSSLALPPQEQLVGGDLALERDPRGRYYYSYTSAGSSTSQTHDSGYDERLSGQFSQLNHGMRPRPSSMHLNWLAAQQIKSKDVRRPKPSISVPSFHTHHSDPLPSREHVLTNGGVDKELLQLFELSVPPTGSLTDCSECGTLLDAIRYVCSTCGEKLPVEDKTSIKGKRRDSSPGRNFTYPPHRPPFSTSPVPSASSQTYIGSTETVYDPLTLRHKPLPSVPSSLNLTVPGSPSTRGYELCSGCIESAGVHHAIEAGIAPGSSPGLSAPASPEDAQAASQWRRAAPRKGQLRHAYKEKVWGHDGWENVGKPSYELSLVRLC